MPGKAGLSCLAGNWHCQQDRAGTATLQSCADSPSPKPGKEIREEKEQNRRNASDSCLSVSPIEYAQVRPERWESESYRYLQGSEFHVNILAEHSKRHEWQNFSQRRKKDGGKLCEGFSLPTKSPVTSFFSKDTRKCLSSIVGWDYDEVHFPVESWDLI